VESGLLSVRLWMERHRTTGFPIEALTRRLDEEWALTRKTLLVVHGEAKRRVGRPLNEDLRRRIRELAKEMKKNGSATSPAKVRDEWNGRHPNEPLKRESVKHYLGK
jgi:hypothetical protein